VNTWLGSLLREKGVDIFRAKGVLAISGMSAKFVFQSVHMVFDGQPMEGDDGEWAEGEERKSRLVFIGKNLDRGELTRAFESCLVTETVS
jgi:G3E family GTPase